MTATFGIVVCLTAKLLFCNAYITRRVLLDRLAERRKKIAWIALIWLTPVIGAAGALRQFRVDPNPSVNETADLR
jgi:hypothetical protein